MRCSIRFFFTFSWAAIFYYVVLYNAVDDEKTINLQKTSILQANFDKECVCKSKKTGKLYDFCYRLPENSTAKGKRFSCEWTEKWEETESTKNFKIMDLKFDKIPEEPVLVTAFDEPFWRNGLRLISAIRKLGFHTKIVIYDLGIKPENVQKLWKTSCNVEIRQFDFSKYPSYVKKLKEYRWKAIVIAESLRDFGAIWYLDSSIIWQKSNVSHVYQLLDCQKTVGEKRPPPMLSDGQRDVREGREKHEDGWDEAVWRRNVDECRKAEYLLHGYSGHGILSVTNPVVYTYFPTNPTLLKKKKAKMYEANLIFAVNTVATIDIVKWTYLCALEADCMGPEGSVLGCSFPGDDRFTKYAGCHRYDQSIMNLLLANRYWYDRHFYASEIVDFFQISRVETQFEEHLGCIRDN